MPISLSAIENAIKRKSADEEPAPAPAPPVDGNAGEGSGKRKKREAPEKAGPEAKRSKPESSKDSDEAAKKRSELKRQIEAYESMFSFERTKALDWDTTPVPDLELYLHDMQRRVSTKNDIAMYRGVLVTVSATAEKVGCGMGMNLTNYAANVQANIERFDDCLKEISIKYCGASASCEAALLMLMAQLALQTYQTNRMAAPRPQPEVKIEE